MKKIFFYSLLLALVFLTIFIILKIFLNSYSIVLYNKHPKSEFVKFIKESKIQEINKDYALPETHKGDELEQRKPHPYCGFKTQAGVKVREGYYTNSLGERSPELGPKENGTIRIAIIGGSVAFNGSVNDKSIIGILAELLRKQGHRVEYINAAIVSSISNQELSVLIHDILDLEVDLLVSFDGFNDIAHPLYYNGRIGWPPFRWDETSATKGKSYVKQLAPSYYPAIDPLLQHMTSQNFIKIVENYLNNINKISVITRAFNISYLGVLQPMRGFESTSCQLTQNLSPESMFYCSVIPVFNQWDDQRSGAAYISLADYLTKHDELFSDECHFNDQGNELVAKKLLEIINSKHLLAK